LKYKRVYLDPWPTDAKLTSPFMRMTASHVKPFWVLQFIRENNISGKMFNYWTEGGFIAYGQHPDPETGKTPLQLFMDGRAQAAYEPEAFMNWNGIMTGTKKGAQIVYNAKRRRQKLTAKDYRLIGSEFSKTFRKDGVWVVLMPINDRSALIIKSLQADPEWSVAFYNNKQMMLVDTKVEHAKKLITGIVDGTTKFPDEYSRNLTIAHNLLAVHKDGELVEQGLLLAIQANELLPSQNSMREIFNLSTRTRDKKVINIALQYCDQHYNDFIENKEEYEKQHGYLNRLISAMTAGDLLRLAHKSDQEKVKQYSKQIVQWQKEATYIQRSRVW